MILSSGCIDGQGYSILRVFEKQLLGFIADILAAFEMNVLVPSLALLQAPLLIHVRPKLLLLHQQARHKARARDANHDAPDEPDRVRECALHLALERLLEPGD